MWTGASVPGGVAGSSPGVVLGLVAEPCRYLPSPAGRGPRAALPRGLVGAVWPALLEVRRGADGPAQPPRPDRGPPARLPQRQHDRLMTDFITNCFGVADPRFWSGTAIEFWPYGDDRIQAEPLVRDSGKAFRKLRFKVEPIEGKSIIFGEGELWGEGSKLPAGLMTRGPTLVKQGIWNHQNLISFAFW